MHNRELLPVPESISSCTTYSEAQSDLGLNDRIFNRARSRLKVLYTCFATGKPVPKQRRAYRSRKALGEETYRLDAATEVTPLKKLLEEFPQQDARP
jgi:hypothetical protein